MKYINALRKLEREGYEVRDCPHNPERLKDVYKGNEKVMELSVNPGNLTESGKPEISYYNIGDYFPKNLKRALEWLEREK